jgi:predicted transglutaminase-like cysteine proteinase
MSVAADYRSRLYSPIHLTDGFFYNEINSFFEWSWDGPEPLNLRESKFVSLVSVNSVINMTNAGMNPTDSEYWLSKRYDSGSPDDYVIIKW